MSAMKKGQGTGSDSFLETKAGPILYIVVAIVSLWFLIWFGNYKGELG